MSSMSTADAYNAGFVTGEYIERERIIALLEQHQCTFTDTETIGCWCGSFNDAIALIKGENE